MAIVLAPGENQAPYFFSYRRAVGLDAQLPSTYADRLNVHQHLSLDSWTRFYAATRDGEGYLGTGDAPLVTLVAHDETSAVVDVAYSCAVTPPSITADPGIALDATGTKMSFAAYVTNMDNRKCDSDVFDLTVSGPDGWSVGAAASAFPLMPLATGATTVVATGPASAHNGSYPLTFAVRRRSDPNDVVEFVRDAVVSRPADFAVTSLKVAKKVTLRSAVGVIAKTLTVTIQNRDPAPMTIPDVATLRALVQVAGTSLGPCGSPTIELVPPKKLPIVLKPKKKLTLKYTVRFVCANDSLATTKVTRHDDYRFTATVHHEAIDGNTDTHPDDDTCPRGPLPTLFDPLPDYSIRDQGCGPRVFGLPGGAVLTDVVVK
jgi:hypothetical protein